MTRSFLLLTRDHVRTGAAAFAIVILLTQPAPALDRLLMLGGVALRPWLENTCSEVEEIRDLALLEARRQRVLTLQAEAASQVKEKIDLALQAMLLWANAPDAQRANAKEVMDAAQENMLAAKENETTVNEQLPVVLRCIEQRKAQLAVEPAVGMPPGGDGASGVVSAACGSPGGGVAISTSVNTPCSLNVGALFGGLAANAMNDMRVETQPSHGRVEWSNGILTYTPDPDYRGHDSFTMSATHNIAVEGKLVSAGRENQVWGILVQ